jgi:hypothetical protein
MARERWNSASSVVKNTQKHVHDIKDGTGVLVVCTDKEETLKNELRQNMMFMVLDCGT